MKAQILGLSAAALLLAASASIAVSATPLSEPEQYARHAQAKADALLRAAGIGPQAQMVSVRAKVDSDGRLAGLQVLRSSGSRDVDRAVANVLRKLIVTDAPIGLMEAAVTLNVGQGDVLEARAQAPTQAQAH